MALYLEVTNISHIFVKIMTESNTISSEQEAEEQYAPVI